MFSSESESNFCGWDWEWERWLAQTLPFSCLYSSPITFRIRSKFLTMPCKALHDLTPACCFCLIIALFPPSSTQCSQHNDAGSVFDPWIWQDCSLLRAYAPAAWDILPLYPQILACFASLPYLVLCLNVISEEIFLTILYQIVPSSFSSFLSYFIFIVFVTTWNNCVFMYLYNIMYLIVVWLHKGREFVLLLYSMYMKQCLAECRLFVDISYVTQ